MKKLLFLFILLNLFLIPDVLAKQGHMKLLAVKETETGYEGGIADLFLEIKPGSGRVFLETFPLTRTDTQMSTRFAKAIACDTIEKDCDDIDFFYTITADSAIIAGPSAGSSIAILTIAMLENLELNENYASTGTINSGGLIGPVGGLKAKVEAAKKAGLEKVFIPAGEVIVRLDNTTTDLKNLSKEIGIEIVEVSTLSEAVKEFTGREIKQGFKNIEINEEYTSTMKSLAKDLCDRGNKLKAEAKELKYSINVSALKENAQNLTIKGKEAFEKQTFYSSASYCFGANVEYSTLLLLSKNLSKEQAIKEVERLNKEISDFRNKVEAQERKTITDLEAYIVVKERLAEAEEYATQSLETLNKTNNTDRIARTLAYASERINSAHSWETFLGKKGKSFNLNKDVLKKSCQSKISEADERKQYVELYFPSTLNNIKRDIDKAGAELDKGNYELCLSMASKAKADVDIILSVFGVDNSQYKNIVERKLEIVKNNIAREAAKGIFPILGYSYYEYANSLKDSDVFSALLYSEYALELGNLDIYFKESNGKKKGVEIDKNLLSMFFIGVIVGIVAASLIRRKNTGIKKKKK
ncbi:MAG: S16 family serine protease [Nanoarchaeota archaeon]|nr:S16 family serine protease [Nanoarchaeota archaeon]